MSASASMVNDSGGANQVKFARLSHRLSKVQTDITHRVRAKGGLDVHQSAMPSTGDRGCHFQDELERSKALDTCSRFKRFYYAVWPLCQSLPELYHHAAKIASMLEEQISLCAAFEVGTFMQLVSVLARDLQEDIWPFFHRLFAVLIGKLNAVIHAIPGSPSPELTGQLFECLSYLIKYAMATLVDDHDSMRQYYGALLGHATAFVRDMSAKCLVMLLRKLKQTAYVSHVKRLLKAVAGQFRQVLDVTVLPIAILEARDSQQGTGAASSSDFTTVTPRMMHLIEGIALLLYYTARGVKGCLHSKGALKFTLPLECMMPVSQEFALEVLKTCASSSNSAGSSNGKKEGKKSGTGTGSSSSSSSSSSNKSSSVSSGSSGVYEPSPRSLSTFSPAVQQAYSGEDANDEARKRKELLAYCSGQVMGLMTIKIFRHIHPKNMAQLWLTLLDSIAKLVVQFRSLVHLADLSPSVISCAECSMLNCIEIITWCTTHSNGRGLSDKGVRSAVSKQVVQISLDLVEIVFVYLQIGHNQQQTRGGRSKRVDALTERNRYLFCRVWMAFPRDASLLQRIDSLLAYAIKAQEPTPAVLVFSNELFGALPSDVVKRHLVRPVLQAVVALTKSNVAADMWLVVVLEIFLHLKDVRAGMLGSTSENGEIGVDIQEMKSSKKAQVRDKQEEWDAMNYENESGESECDEKSQDEVLQKLLKSCSKELLLLAYAAVDALQRALVGAPSAASLPQAYSSDISRNVGVLACMVLRWVAKAFPASLHDQWNTSEQYSLLQGLLVMPLTRNFAGLSAQLGSPFLAHVVVFLCAEKNGDMLYGDAMKEVLRSYAQYFTENSHSLSCAWGLLEMLRHMDVRQGHKQDITLILGADLSISVLESISIMIATPSYWLRLHLLHIAAYFPAPQLLPPPEGEGKADEVATFDIVSLLLEAASTSPHLRTEREYVRRMSSLEVIVRGRRIPPVYMKLVCSLCLSMLHTKFQPFWEPTITVLVAAGGFNEGEIVLWPLLLRSIVTLGARGVDCGGGDDVEEAEKDLLKKEVGKQKRRLQIANDDADEEDGEVDEEDNYLAQAPNAERKPLLHACLLSLFQLDNGELPVPMEVATSKVFFYNLPPLSSDILVVPDSRVDADTAYQSSWAILRRVPAITMKRSKVVVPMFMSFLVSQYYRMFSTDPELPWLRHFGLFNTPTTQVAAEHLSATQESEVQLLSLRILKTRLKMFLQVFSQVSSPKSLYQHKFLYSFYIALLSNPEASMSSLALDCLCTYKPVYLVPFKENLKRMLDDRYMRDELVTFDISIKNTAMDPKHREDLIPLIVRLAYGRFAARAKSSRASKEQSLARRVAVLTFLSSLELSEQMHLVQLIYRTIIPKDQLMEIAVSSQGQERDVSLAQQHSVWYQAAQHLLMALTSGDMQQISWERQSGFLHLLQQIIRILGFSVAQHVPVFAKLVIIMLTNAQAVRGGIESDAKEADLDDDDDDLEDNDVEMHRASTSHSHIAQSVRVRTLCLSRLSELVHQYRTVYDFSHASNDMMRPLHPLLKSMPHSIAGATKPPALLRILHALVQYPETIAVVGRNSDTVTTIIRCVGSRVEFEVAKVVMDIITRLLDFNSGESILSHAPLIIQSFSKRFVGAAFNEISDLKLSELNIVPSGSVKQELNLLCRIAEGIFIRTDVAIDAQAVGNLATLLLGMLRTYTTNKKIRVEESWAADILRIYITLIPRMTDVQPHVAFISRLFGPAGHSQSLFNNANIRGMLALAYTALSRHPSTNGILLPCAAAITNLVKIDSTLLGRNYSTCMPIFQALSSEKNNAFPAVLTVALDSSQTVYANLDEDEAQRIEGWSSLMGYTPASCLLVRNGQMCTVILYECLRCMYDEEVVVRTAALASIKSLVKNVFVWNASIDAHMVSEGDNGEQKIAHWSDILLATLMPAIRKGLKESPDQIKKGFISILSCVVTTLGRTQAGLGEPFFHADLLSLLHEDPEQDFFENITHVQTHRRVRAIMKLRLALAKSSGTVKLADLGIEEENSEKTINLEAVESAAVPFDAPAFFISPASLVHILLPLAFHPLVSDDFAKKDHTLLMHEAAHFVGAIALHLNWTQYFTQIKYILKQLDRNKTEKERILLLGLCSLLDGFHFDMSGEEEAEGINVQLLRGEMPSEAPAPAENQNEDEEVNPGAITEDNKTEGVEKPTARCGQPLAATGKNISQIVINSVMPWVQVFLLKDEKDHKGIDSKVVRTGIAVALTKLICRLQAPVVPEKKKLALFMNLVIRVVGTLKSRDTSARDQARDSLSKMIITMGMAFLKPVIYELQHSLIEGYQRHVCNYTLRSLLSTVIESLNYLPPLDALCIPVLDDGAPMDKIDLIKPEFDTCIPMIMHSVMDDLNGIALDDREAEGAIRQTIREAKGSKANEILEMTAKSLLFRPTYALKCIEEPQSVSSVHALSAPMLDALNNCEDADLIGRINEGLQRVALGLSKNPSIVASELLLYLHATLQPFIAAIIRDYEQHKRSLGMLNSSIAVEDVNLCDADDGFLDDLPSYLKEESSDEEDAALYSKKKSKGDNVTGHKANTWLPMERRSLTDQKSVIEQRNKEIKERDQVLDGASAPKLTGSSRHRTIKSKSSSSATAGGGSDPAAIVAVKFCLTLFLSAIKKNQLDSGHEETRTMCIPFIPLLGQCLRIPGAANVVALSMRCLCALLSWNLPVDSSFSRAVGARMMKVMFRGGVLLSTDNELVQACIRGLTSLFDLYNAQKEARKDESKKETGSHSGKRKASSSALVASLASGGKTEALSHPLSENNTRTLLKMMTVSIMEVTSSYQNAAFQLIKSIIKARVMVPEIYDLITKLTEQIVLSQRKGVRSSASQIVVDFMTSYPLGEKRLQGHMKQLIANCSFEHEDGRHATLETLQHLCRSLPLAALEDHAHMIFLPMTLRLVNDATSSCREAAASVITALGRRVGGEMFGVLLGFAVKWISSGDAVGVTSPAEQALDSSARALIRTGSQCSGLLVTARPDLIKKSAQFHAIIKSAARCLLNLMHMSHNSQASRGSLEKREMAKFDEGVGEAGGTESWAAIYHILVMVETFYTHLPSGTDTAITHFTHAAQTPVAAFQEASSSSKKRRQDDAQQAKAQAPGGVLVMEIVQEAMLFPHAWVRAAAARVLCSYLQRRDVNRSKLATSATGTEILLQPNALYHLARRLCIVLNQPVLSESLLRSASTSLVFVIRAMFQNPELAVLPEESAEQSAAATDAGGDGDDDAEGDGDEEDDDDDDDEDDGAEDEEEAVALTVANAKMHQTMPSSPAALPKTGASWTMQRLRGLGVDSRGNRRHYVLTVLRMLVASCSDAESGIFLKEHLSQIIEVAMRSHLTASGPDLVALKALKEEAGILLDELEAKVGAALYIGTFSEVQRKVETSKANKKRLQAMDAVTNPAAFAMAKVKKK